MRPVRPVFTALCDEVSLPVGEVGPVLIWALARLALSWASEMLLEVVLGDAAVVTGEDCG